AHNGFILTAKIKQTPVFVLYICTNYYYDDIYYTERAF
ncbi:MAG: hypothetical protein JWR54_1711, partial [Mucilaginibacter sp.]|nr:hypothetical protein [Mucilaginibacter sp.]